MGPSYPMDLRLWRQNVDDDPQHDPSGILVAQDGAVPVGFVVARRCRVPMGAEGLREGEGWINSLAVAPPWQRQGLGSALLQRAEMWLKSQGSNSVRLGGDPGHFLPGVASTQMAAKAFFQGAGYGSLGVPCYDVHRDIREFEIPPQVARTMATRVAFRTHECTSRTVPALLDFLEADFSGRMLYETRLRLEAERSPQEIRIMSLGTRVVGFAHTYTGASLRLGPSVYWRKAMEGRVGGLGPVGLSKDVRGQGLGLVLLCHCIEYLRKAGVEQMVIDWTTNLAFYGIAGFEPCREYRAYGKAL